MIFSKYLSILLLLTLISIQVPILAEETPTISFQDSLMVLPKHQPDQGLNRANKLLEDTDELIEEAKMATIQENIDKEVPEENPGIAGNSALLRGLNKITARTSSIPIDKGNTAQYRNLEITLHECWKTPPSEQPEAKALIEIWEQKTAANASAVSGKEKIFSGWMFSSSPSLNAMEHPVYDITVQDCRT